MRDALIARAARAAIGAALDLLNLEAASLDVVVATGALDWKEAVLYFAVARSANKEAGERLELLSVGESILRIRGGAARNTPFEPPESEVFGIVGCLSGR